MHVIKCYHEIDHIFKFTYFVFQVLFVTYVTNKVSCMTNNEANNKVKVLSLESVVHQKWCK